MPITVLDFYTRKKISTHPSFSITMTETEFTMLVEYEGEIREWVLSVPKKYPYKSSLFNPSDFKQIKLKEFNVLSDFIKNNERMVSEKWKLSDKTIKELPKALELCLIMNYTDCSLLKKIVLMCIAKLDLALVRFG